MMERATHRQLAYAIVQTVGLNVPYAVLKVRHVGRCRHIHRGCKIGWGLA